MKRCCFCLLLISICFLKGYSTPFDSISTTYRDGEFITYCQVQVKASDSVCNAVATDFSHQMRYDLDKLFTWALKGLNLRKEKNDIMVFNFKSTSYNKETEVIRGVGDVIVPKVITFPNVVVDSRFVEKRYANGVHVGYINLFYSNAFLKKMYGTFKVIPVNGNKTFYTLETHVKFGWFFDIFITQNRFKKIVEWRFSLLMKNLKTEAEKREDLR